MFFVKSKGALFGLLGSRSTCTILEEFLESPKTEMHAALVQKRTGLAKKSVLDGLKKLYAGALLKRRESAGAIFYSIDGASAVARELAKVLALRKVCDAFKPLDGLAEIYLYGSCARGEANESSDLDVLVVTGDRNGVAKIRFGESIKPLIFSPLEFAALRKVDAPLYQSIMRDRLRVF